MPDLTISNTSPLFYLHRLNHLDLLRRLYQCKGTLSSPRYHAEQLHRYLRSARSVRSGAASSHHKKPDGRSATDRTSSH